MNKTSPAWALGFSTLPNWANSVVLTLLLSRDPALSGCSVLTSFVMLAVLYWVRWLACPCISEQKQRQTWTPRSIVPGEGGLWANHGEHLHRLLIPSSKHSCWQRLVLVDVYGNRCLGLRLSMRNLVIRSFHLGVQWCSLCIKSTAFLVNFLCTQW
jgi:hypothetical protein